MKKTNENNIHIKCGSIIKILVLIVLAIITFKVINSNAKYYSEVDLGEIKLTIIGNKYNITFDSNYSDGETKKIDFNDFEEIKEYKSQKLERDGYTFIGWFDNKDYMADGAIQFYDGIGNCIIENYEKKNITLYAGWTSDTYKIVCHLDYIEDDEIPKGYDRLEYIEGTGTQYIDTEINPNQDTTTEMQFEFNQTGTQFLFGARLSYPKKSHLAVWQNKIRFDYGDESGKQTNSLNINEKHIVKLDKNISYFDGKKDMEFTETEFNSGFNMYLFAANTNNSVSGIAKMNLYYTKIWDDESLVRDYVPCIRKSDKEIGLYDKVNKKFYTNKGTGKFVSNVNIYEETVGINEKRKLNSQIYVKEGYTLKQWKDEDGNLYDKDKVIENLTTVKDGVIDLYPVAVQNQCKVSFNANGGNMNLTEDIIVKYDEEMPEIDNIIPTREGYVFVGWYDKYDYTKGTQYYDSQGNVASICKISKDITLYAGWAKIINGLKTTGKQYIKTGYIPNQDTKVEMEVSLLSSGMQFLYGARNNYQLNTYSLGYINGSYRFDYNVNTISANCVASDKDLIYQDANKLYINGTEVKSYEKNNFYPTTTKDGMYLFNTNTSGGIGVEDSERFAEVEFYYCKIWNESNQLVRDFIPVENCNDKIALFDKVEKKLYYPYGGDFEKIN